MLIFNYIILKKKVADNQLFVNSSIFGVAGYSARVI